jgi:hypothetical protein
MGRDDHVTLWLFCSTRKTPARSGAACVDRGSKYSVPIQIKIMSNVCIVVGVGRGQVQISQLGRDLNSHLTKY